MQPPALRWALWGGLFLYATLILAGLSQFAVPPDDSIPLISIARKPPTVAYASYRRTAELDLSANEARLATYRELVAGRWDRFHAVVGPTRDFPVPSVTYLSNIQVYLVRSAAGFVALWGRDPEREFETHWYSVEARFIEPRRGSTYSLTGLCLSGPCSDDLGRYAVEQDGDNLLIDLRVRTIQNGFRID